MNPIDDLVDKATRAVLLKRGFAIVPIEATEGVLSATDPDGDLIWDGGAEHYFRNSDEARWYGRRVWRAMVSAAIGN